MVGFCINIQDRENVHKKIHIKTNQEDIKLLSLILAESRLVIGFWQE